MTRHLKIEGDGTIRRHGRGWAVIADVRDPDPLLLGRDRRYQKWISGFATRKAAEAMLAHLHGLPADVPDDDQERLVIMPGFPAYAKSGHLRNRRLHLVARAVRVEYLEDGHWFPYPEVWADWECGGRSKQPVATDKIPPGYDLCSRCAAAVQLREVRDHLLSAYAVPTPMSGVVPAPA